MVKYFFFRKKKLSVQKTIQIHRCDDVCCLGVSARAYARNTSLFYKVKENHEYCCLLFDIFSLKTVKAAEAFL